MWVRSSRAYFFPGVGETFSQPLFIFPRHQRKLFKGNAGSCSGVFDSARLPPLLCLPEFEEFFRSSPSPSHKAGNLSRFPSALFFRLVNLSGFLFPLRNIIGIISPHVFRGDNGPSINLSHDKILFTLLPRNTRGMMPIGFTFYFPFERFLLSHAYIQNDSVTPGVCREEFWLAVNLQEDFPRLGGNQGIFVLL